MKHSRLNAVLWLSLMSICLSVNARTGITLLPNAGINIGGTSPIPIPAEIRQINGFNPNFNWSTGVTAIIDFNPSCKWDLYAGIRFEKKSMTTDARVKNYSTSITDDEGSEISGMWTGYVNTTYSSTGITIPVTASYKLFEALRIQAGPYVSFLTDRKFYGHVYDGYMRHGDPTGPKTVFENGDSAPFEFNDQLKPFQYGICAGLEWNPVGKIIVSGLLSWGLDSAFKDSFKTIDMKMYPIYFNLSLGYRITL